MRRILPVLFSLILLPNLVFAQSDGTLSSKYATVLTSRDTITAPDGTMTLEETYTITHFADDAESPFARLVGHCWGTVVLESEDSAIGAGGACHMTDSEGNGFWQWWQFDEAGTEPCPIRCGTFGDYNGYGRFEGYTAKGTWNLTALFANGSVTGVSRGTFEWR